MPPTERIKHPLAILQSMINGILIETGKALRASDKDSGKTLSQANARLRSTIPSAIDNFHQALDEIESNIVRAKAVLTRDLEELRAKRLAADNLVTQPPEDTATTENAKAVEEPTTTEVVVNDTLSIQQPLIEENNISGKPQEAEPSMKDIGHEGEGNLEVAATSGAENTQPVQPAPSDAVGLGIDTGEEKHDDVGQQTDEQHDILNELFDMDGNNHAGDSSLSYDGMDFSLQSTDTANNDQTQDQSQLQNHSFDLSTFGDASQGNNIAMESTHNHDALNLNDAPVLQDTASGDRGETADKQNLFGLGENTNGTDAMNIDFDTNMVGGDDSMFDDLFFNTEDNNNLSGGGGNGGEFDDAFFGLDN
ncbi:hypothetical protein B7463_g12004, partial [Scytalidium lignicola]